MEKFEKENKKAYQFVEFSKEGNSAELLKKRDESIFDFQSIKQDLNKIDILSLFKNENKNNKENTDKLYELNNDQNNENNDLNLDKYRSYNNQITMGNNLYSSRNDPLLSNHDNFAVSIKYKDDKIVKSKNELPFTYLISNDEIPIIKLDVPYETKIFEILYQNNKFYFRCLTNSPEVIIVIKVTMPKWKISNNDKFLLGDMILKFEVDFENISITRLQTKRHPNKLNHIFNLSDLTDDTITIGRGKTCNVFLESSILSRVHARVMYNKIQGIWEFSDGDNEKPSSNGCFIFTDEKIEIDRLEVRINEETLSLEVESI